MDDFTVWLTYHDDKLIQEYGLKETGMIRLFKGNCQIYSWLLKNIWMRIVTLTILSFFSDMIYAQTGSFLDSEGNLFINVGLSSVITDINTCDMMFEGYESRKIYDREYILGSDIQTRSYKGVTLPPSVYLKLWETHMDTIANTITKTGNVQLYWVGPRSISANSKKIWDKMINLCGVRKLSFITNGDSIISLYAVPADWMHDDTLFAVSRVKKIRRNFCLVT